jgi:two-component system, sensor histidine kinase and response regulator
MDLLTRPILIVDDYPPGLYARTKVLQQAGFAVLQSATGAEALRIVDEHSPALILLDVNLPDISGFEVCQRVKRNPKTAHTTVVHVSASNTQTNHQVHGLNSGADCYLVEPVDPTVLVATVKAFLRARTAEDSLRQSNEELERFAYFVAHELNEPLRTIATHTQLLKRKLSAEADPTISECVGFVVEGALNMRSFIDDILRYSQATHVTSDVRVIPLEGILNRVIAHLGASIQSSGTKITHDPLPTLAADPRVENVFQNLISNAIKYRRPDVAPEIHISARQENDAWVVGVKDNGIGIRPEYQKRIFQAFRRLHGKEIPGNGIGLALCQKVIEARGGRLWVESEPGGGSTFYFTLPHQHAASVAG